MDVADLAPALVALSDLCKLANRKFNGDKAAVQVLIGTDVEHKCFQFDLHVVQSIWDHTKTLLSSENVHSAKEILEWIGLFGLPPGMAGFFELLKRLKRRKITSTAIESRDGKDVVRIAIDGDHNTVLIVPPQALDLVRDAEAVQSAKKLVQPLTKNGYESLEFESKGGVIQRFETADAIEITSLDPGQVEDAFRDEPQSITAWVTVYSPVYDPKAPKWRFKFGDSHEYMDITETDIASQAMKRGGAMVDDAYRVELEIVQEIKPGSSTFSNFYKIKRVLDFKPARVPFQSDTFKD